jgi:hypothetical protein
MAVESLDFLNLNSLRSFPIKEGLSKIDTLGSFVIPNDLIVDLQVAASYDPSNTYYISKLSNFEDSLTIEIADQDDVLVGTFNIDAATHTKNKVYYLGAGDDYTGATGEITIGTLDSLHLGPSGVFQFTLATTELEMRTSIPALKGINRIKFLNANGESYTLTGDVEIEARTNLKFKLGVGNRIILDAGEGIGLNTICEDERDCIKTVNGIPPDEFGNFTLDFSDCATLTPIPANTGLLLEDVCCKPCVGCTDIEELTQRLMNAETSLFSLRDFYNNLNVLYQQFRTTVTYTCDCPPE